MTHEPLTPCRVTPTQLERINAAVDRAQGAGKCVYERNGEPRCVIAQLAVIEGATPTTLQIWDHFLDGRDGSSIEVLQRRGAAEVTLLNSYPADLLQLLQRNWDSPSFEDPDTMTDEQMDEEARAMLKQWVRVNVVATPSTTETPTP